MNLSILGSWYKAKEDNKEQLEALLHQLVEQSLNEEGCVFYEFYEERKNPGQFFLLEKWDSREAFAAHSKMAFLAEAFKNMEELLAEPYKLVTYKMPGQ